jgi:uncharacterized protein
MPRPVHFQLSAEDPERAAKFFSTVFGWEFQKWEGRGQDYWLIKTGEAGQPGIDGGMNRRTEFGPGTTNTVDVPSIDEAIVKVGEAGGQITLPKVAIPGVGWLAYFKDTEGNSFGLMQADPSAR